MRPLFLLVGLFTCAWAWAQNTVVFQGFETPPNCPDWGYTGGVVNSEAARTGVNSARVGRAAESNTITFNTVTITGYANVQLSLYHYVNPVGAVPGTHGEGMDVDEGAVIQVQLNGGGWVTQGAVSGYNNTSWNWSTTGGNAFSGCLNTCPNPFVYNVPAGTNTIAVRVFSTHGGCPGSTAASYDRSDEGFFIDDVRITTTSPVVTPGSGSVLWTGSLDTDWFKCQNWNPNVVPGPGWDVTIDQTAVNHCVIGVNVSTPLNAYAASLIVRSNTATAHNLTIDNGRTLTVGGAVSVLRTASTGQFGITVVNGSFTSNSLTLTGTASGLLQALFKDNTPANAVQVNGNVTINAGGILDLQGAPGGTLGVAGDLSNNDVAAAFPKSGSWVLMNGSGAQAMYSITASGEPYGSLRITKPTGDVTLTAPIAVSGTLDLLQGRMFSTATNLVIMSAGSLVSGASNTSFVSGPVRKRGNTNFTFPVGKASYYRPLTIASPGGNSALYFTAEYFMGDPTVAFGTPLDPTLNHVSHCEWWILDRSATQTPLVTLSWDATSCGVTNLADLRVAEWYGAQWRDRGNGGTTGNFLSGTVITSSAQSQFSAPTPWTLASVTTQNLLPIELLWFNAVPHGDEVLAEWATASEHDNDHFDVERSADGISFERIGSLPGAGNSVATLLYELPDTDPLCDVSYYRLRQVDVDGTSTLSNVVPVVRPCSGPSGITFLYGDDGPVRARFDLPAGSRYALLDATGRLVRSGTISVDNTLLIWPYDLAHGTYVLRVDDGGPPLTGRFVR